MIAIIPARSGSKGLPGKNTINLLGKPMIAYTIEEALKSKYITEVIISTDCKEIENTAVKYGATSLFLRPNYLATDNAKVIDNYIYTINRLNNEFHYSIEEFIVLQPTSPLRTVDDINGAIELFQNNNAHSVVSYTEEHHPIQWHKYITDDGKFENIFQDNIQNRQELKKTYFPNGAIFIFKYDLIKQGLYYNDNSYGYIMTQERSIDIDTIDNFNYAEYLLYKRLKEKDNE